MISIYITIIEYSGTRPENVGLVINILRTKHAAPRENATPIAYFMLGIKFQIRVLFIVPQKITVYKQPKFTLLVANGIKIPIYMQKFLNIDLGLLRAFPFVFLITDVQKPIIGADFLSKFRLLVNLRHSVLNVNVTSL
nr:gag pol polyprotein [Hymenolepis microstoma]